MQKFLTALTTAGVLTAVVMATPILVSADTQEVTECTTSAYGVETCTTKKVECTDGAYGKKDCKPVEEKKDERVLGEKKHTPVNSGVAENIMFAVAGLTILSGASLAYSRK